MQTNGNYVAGTESNFVILSEWTITAWIKLREPSLNNGRRTIISSATVGGGNWWSFVVQDFNVQEALLFDFTTLPVSSSITVPLDTVTFVAVVADGGGLGGTTNRHRFAMWDGNGWSLKDGTAFTSIRLDGLEIGTFNLGNRFDGIIDDVCIFDRTLSQFDLDRMTRADTDGDGIPDWKDDDDDGEGVLDVDEVAGGTNTKDPDTDDDSQNDLEESIAGTTGTDSNSFFRIDDNIIMNPGDVSFDTVTGRVYSVDYTDDLNADPQVWMSLLSNFPGIGSPITVSDPDDATNRNYRIRVNLSP